jgi:trehalose 6-phosphate synthase
MQMPVEERRNRHQALMRTVRQYDVHWWCNTFLQALDQAQAEEKGTSWLRL